MTGFSRFQLFAIFVLFFLSLFLRVYRLPETLHYLGDEGRDLLIVRQLLTGQALPLLGPPSSVGQLHLGPFYYYLIAPGLWLSNYHPLGPAMTIVLISSATTVLLYVIGLRIFKSAMVGSLAALIFALSPVAVEYGRWFWNANIMPFLSAWLFWSLYQAYENKQPRWLLSVGLTLGLMVQSHYLGLAGFVLIVAVWVWKRRSLTQKDLFIPLLLLPVTLAPIIVYDLLRDFTNLRGVLEIGATATSATVSYPIRIWQVISQSLGDVLALTPAQVLVGLAAILSTLTIKSRTAQVRWWWLWLITCVAFTGLYPGRFVPHYLEYLWPIWCVGLGLSLEWLTHRQRVIAVAISLGLIVHLGYTSWNWLQTNPRQTLSKTREVANFIAQQANGQAFNFAVLSENNEFTAYQYFFELDKVPSEFQQPTQRLFIVCERNPDCHYNGNPQWGIALFEAAYQGKTQIANRWQLGNNHTILEIHPASL